MVIARPDRRVRAFVAMVIVPAAVMTATVSGAERDTEAEAAIRRALAEGNYPWYDQETDDARPIVPPLPPRPRTGSGSSRSGMFDWPDLSLEDVGRLILFALLAAVLTGMMVMAARSWRRGLGSDRPSEPRRRTVSRGGLARVERLPTGIDIDETDPMRAALACRSRGDLGRAVVLLFAHQLLLLDRLGLIRLSPGRTGRQLVRSISVEDIRGAVSQTLRMFEDVYYGHRDPDPVAFDALWAEAETLEDRLTSGGSP